MTTPQETPRKTHMSLYQAFNAALMATGLGVAVYALAVPSEDKEDNPPPAKKARLQFYEPAEKRASPSGPRTIWFADTDREGRTITYKSVARSDSGLH